MQNKNEKRILIVEDAKDLQSLLRRLLESEGYQVDCANNGKEAIELLASAEALPGLILLDIMMPIMDGFQFREAQEKDPKIASIPVVIMTAAGDIQSKSMKIGSKGVLKKPFGDIGAILDIVDRHCIKKEVSR